MNHLKLFVVGTLASLALGQDALANPAARIQVSDIKTLLIRAIDQGSAQGVLVVRPPPMSDRSSSRPPRSRSTYARCTPYPNKVAADSK
jgi:hypothetical protein